MHPLLAIFKFEVRFALCRVLPAKKHNQLDKQLKKTHQIPSFWNKEDGVIVEDWSTVTSPLRPQFAQSRYKLDYFLKNANAYSKPPWGSGFTVFAFSLKNNCLVAFVVSCFVLCFSGGEWRAPINWKCCWLASAIKYRTSEWTPPFRKISLHAVN